VDLTGSGIDEDEGNPMKRNDEEEDEVDKLLRKKIGSIPSDDSDVEIVKKGKIQGDAKAKADKATDKKSPKKRK